MVIAATGLAVDVLVTEEVQQVVLEVRACCRHNVIPPERADMVDVPLWLTKRGVLVRASNR